MEDVIATADLFCVGRSGEEWPLKIRVQKPIQAEPTQAKCSFIVESIDPKVRTMYGEDTLSALSAALRHIRFIVGDFIERGGRIRLTEDDEQSEVPLDLLFPPPL